MKHASYAPTVSGLEVVLENLARAMRNAATFVADAWSEEYPRYIDPKNPPAIDDLVARHCVVPSASKR